MTKQKYIKNYKLHPDDKRTDEHFAFKDDFTKCLLAHVQDNGRKLPTATVAIGVSLVDHRSRTDKSEHKRKGTAWPRLMTLAKHARIGGKSDANKRAEVSKALKVLEKEGFLVKVKNGYGYDNGDSASAIWGFRIPSQDLEWLRSLHSDQAEESTGVEGFEKVVNSYDTMRPIEAKWDSLRGDSSVPVSLLIESTREVLEQHEFTRANWGGFLSGCAEAYWSGDGASVEDREDDVWAKVLRVMRDSQDAYSSVESEILDIRERV